MMIIQWKALRRLSWSQMVLVTWVPPLRVNTWVALHESFHFTEPHLFNRNSTTYCLGSPKDSLDHVKIQKHNRYKTWTQYTGVWGHIYFLWRFRAVIGGRKEESRTLRSTSVCEKFKSRCNLKSLNDLLEMILKDERPSICRHPVVIWGTSICSCICTENPAFFLLECLPPHSHHHDHNRIPAGEWRAEAKWCFIFQPWQVLVTTKPHQGDIWMPGWKKRYLNPQHPRHPFRNRGLGGKRVHWLKSRTDTLPWYWENQMSSEGPKEGFPGGPVVKTLHLTLQRVWAGFLVGERRSHMPHGMAKI